MPAREPFVVRAYSPVRTIGGGRVLDPTAARRRRFDDGALGYLQALAGARSAQVVAARLRARGRAPRMRAGRAGAAGGVLGRAGPAVGAAGAGAELFGDGTALHGDACRELEGRLLAGLGAFHREQPGEPGLPKERLRAMLPEGVTGPVFGELAAKLVDRGLLVRERGVVRRTDFRPLGRGRGTTGGGSPARSRRRSGGAGSRRRISRRWSGRTRGDGRPRACSRGRGGWCALDRVQRREVVFHREAIVRAKGVLEERFADGGGFSVSEAGQALGISRKYSVPLLEHLDSVGFTRRVGDRRVVVRRRASARTA